MQKPSTYTFADLFVDHIIAKEYDNLRVLDDVIDWEQVEIIVEKAYNFGKQPNGRPAYSGMLLFRMQLIALLYRLSDRQAASQCSANVCFRRFIGLGMADQVPNYSRLCHFRKWMNKSDAFKEVHHQIIDQLKAMGLIDSTNISIDSTVTQSMANVNTGKKKV